MARKRAPLKFPQTVVSRVLRGYRAAGEPQPIMRFTRSGDMIAIPAESGTVADETDRELKEFEARHGKA
jgi:hypothetical protein